jgi:cytochrome P450
MSFGAGVQFGLGARLATMQLEVALGTLFQRLPNLTLTNLDALHWRPTSTFRSAEALHAKW